MAGPGVIGPYRILGEIARGGMGVVYRARDERAPGAPAVALKLLHRNDEPRLRRRFQRELEALARLRHPHVVAVLDSGEVQGCPYLVMELIEGESLAERLRRGPLRPAQAVALVDKLARALIHVHGRGVLHRDVKPGNVLIGGQGEPRLTDFGLAGYANRGSSLSREGHFLGTPGYAAPEQILGQLDKLGPPADVYGLGATLFAALTGESPNPGSSLGEIVGSIQQDPRPPSALVDGVDPALDRIVLQALAVELDDRYPDAESFLADLERYRLTLSASGAYTSGRAPTRGYSQAAVVSLGVILLGVGVAVGLLLSQGGPRGSGQVPPGPTASTGPSVSASASERPPSLPPATASSPAASPGRPADLMELLRSKEVVPPAATPIEVRPRPEGMDSLGRASLDSKLAAAQDIWKTTGPEAAIGFLRGTVIPFHREDTRPYARLAQFLLREGQDREAIDLADWVAARDPAFAGFRGYIRGVSASQHGQWETALYWLDESLVAKASCGPAHSERGAVLAELGRIDEALAAWHEATRIDPTQSSPYLNRARVLMAEGRLEAALAEAKLALRFDSRNPQSHCQVGSILSDMDRPREALRAFNRAAELYPAPPPYLFAARGLAKAKLSDHARAVVDFNVALEHDPDNREILFSRGRSRIFLHQAELARQDLLRARQLYPPEHPSQARITRMLDMAARQEEVHESSSQPLTPKPPDE